MRTTIASVTWPVAMVVRMLIEEFGVAPLRPDWQKVLDRADQIAG